MASPDPSSQVAAGVASLSLQPESPAAPQGSRPESGKKQPSQLAESWEDDVSSESETESGPADGKHTGTLAPPPTPMSPRDASFESRRSAPILATASPTSPVSLALDPPGNSGSPGPPRRPEKTDAVARRMIAGALGLRAPKMTEEQRAYDRAVREKERRRKEEERERERERQAEAERAKKAVWGD
ncbi:hypothetical protein VTK73DRAFT_8355 [Phialemonium thermophilum]|uniref:Uncharacterized protein n=1 Tax=Phialemonium thermophilum TaxID=223376 RepID=A0ABR3Y7Y4_9PEZI